MLGDTWLIVDTGDTPRWVRKSGGQKLEVHLGVKGFKQRQGDDFYGYNFHEVYAAVAKPMSFETLVALTAHFNWHLLLESIF